MKKTGSAGTNWKYASYFLEKSINTSIILRAARSKLDIGDIAVDDFKINTGTCPTISKYSNHLVINLLCSFNIINLLEWVKCTFYNNKLK